MTCPYAHYLGYEVGVRSNKPQRPLYFGSDFHRLLEVRSDSKKVKEAKSDIEDTFYSFPANWQGDLGETYLEDLFSIFDDYCDIYKAESLPSKTEKEFEIPLFAYRDEPYTFKGFIDELYLLKNRVTGKRKIVIGEHKTFSVRPSTESLIMNTQKNLYAKAVQALYGVLPEKVIWDYIHSRPAPYPVWLEKSKRFSMGKSQQITPYSWLRACKEHGIKDKAILAQAEDFRGNVPSHFFRIEQDYDQSAVDQVWKGFVFQAKLIARYGHKNKTKHMGRDCSWCGYKNICYTQLTGGNLEYLIEQEYTVEPREDIENEERRAKDSFFEQFIEVPFKEVK